jgi:hypothetical protein
MSRVRMRAIEWEALAARRGGPNLARSPSPRGAPLPAQAGLLLSLQESHGNRAVSRLVQRWRAASAQSGRVFPPGERRSAAIPSGASTRRAAGIVQASRGVLQRRTIKEGSGKKVVKFKLNTLSATLPAGLKVVKSATDVEIGSNDYNATGTVTASGPATEVAKYELGFVQTLFQNKVRFRYKRIGHHRTIGERLFPGILGKNMELTSTSGLLPVKDGDDYVSGGNKRDKLYYEKNDVKDFGNANPDQRTTTLFDRPTSPELWSYNHKGHAVWLIGTSGMDSFRTWLIIRKKSWSSTDYRRLGYIDWTVDYESNVTPDQNTPANSVVTPGGNSGGHVDAPVKGVGVYLPVAGADSANASLKDTKSSW